MGGITRLLTSELLDGPSPRCFREPCPRGRARSHAPATLVQADDARDEQAGGAEEGESSQPVSELGFWEGPDPEMEPFPEMEPEQQPEGGESKAGGVLGDEGGGGDAGGGGGGGGNAGGDGRTRPGARDSVWWGWNKRGEVRIDLPYLSFLLFIYGHHLTVVKPPRRSSPRAARALTARAESRWCG